ncbi:MAG: N-acetyltransferase [Coriobacteriia bacterium]|nr:N-acetyltransferase [Coriobacteriia bacterium]
MTTHVLVRLATQTDRPAIRVLLEAAFARNEEADLVDELVDSRAYLPDLELVAEEDAQIVGHVMFTRAVIEEPLPGMMSRSVSAIALGPLSVHPDRQSTGVGAELVREGLDRARILGERVALVVGHPDYYPRFGFHEALPYGIAAPLDIPSEAWMVAELVPGGLADVRGTARLAAPFANPKYW